jgi:uncharacterized protein
MEVGYTSSLMRLASDEIEFIARKIVKTLVSEGKLELDSETRVIEAVVRVITEELMVEDRLNEEVREVLIQHASEMERSNVTYTEMFKMLKKKMAREKGIVL